MYFSVRQEDILTTVHCRGHLARKGPEPIDGTEVWLKQGAPVELKFSDEAKKVQAEFLEGGILSDILPNSELGDYVFRVPAGVKIDVPTWIICGLSPAASIIIAASVAPKTRHHGT